MSQNAFAPVATRELASRFDGFQRLTVRQRKSWWEILTSLEMRNQYDVFDQTQRPALHVREEGSGFLPFLKRFFLGPFRPFTASVAGASQGEPLLQPAPLLEQAMAQRLTLDANEALRRGIVDGIMNRPRN